MPVRPGTGPAPKEKAPKGGGGKKTATTKSKATAPVGDEPEESLQATPPVAAEQPTPEPKAGKVEKVVSEERARKFLKEIGVEDKIHEIVNRVVKNNEGGSANVSFITFSENGAADETPDNESNIAIIKDVLFAYHTAPENITSGAYSMLEVLPPQPDTEDPYLLCFQEVNN